MRYGEDGEEFVDDCVAWGQPVLPPRLFFPRILREIRFHPGIGDTAAFEAPYSTVLYYQALLWTMRILELARGKTSVPMARDLLDYWEHSAW